jgi:hypothetical protein
VLRLTAAELAIDADLAAGRHHEVVAEVEALLVEHPLRERLHVQQMLALYRCGRQADALDAYRDARETLVGAQLPIGNPLAAIPNHMVAPLFTRDGAYLFGITDAGLAYRWDVRPSSWARHACAVAGRRLTRAEWQDALPGLRYAPAC